MSFALLVIGLAISAALAYAFTAPDDDSLADSTAALSLVALPIWLAVSTVHVAFETAATIAAVLGGR